MSDIIPLSTNLNLVFWAWCAFLATIWLVSYRCIGYRGFNTFTIYLTANSTAAVKVAWHVFG